MSKVTLEVGSVVYLNSRALGISWKRYKVVRVTKTTAILDNNVRLKRAISIHGDRAKGADIWSRDYYFPESETIVKRYKEYRYSNDIKNLKSRLIDTINNLGFSKESLEDIIKYSMDKAED